MSVYVSLCVFMWVSRRVVFMSKSRDRKLTMKRQQCRKWTRETSVHPASALVCSLSICFYTCIFLLPTTHNTCIVSIQHLHHLLSLPIFLSAHSGSPVQLPSSSPTISVFYSIQFCCHFYIFIMGSKSNGSA